MSTATPPQAGTPAGRPADYQLLFFSQLLGCPVCETRADFCIGKLTDLVFRLAEPYPEAVGIFISHGWGRPTEFIPWERTTRVDPHSIFVRPPESGERYPEFVDQPGWILLNEHLVGKEILDLEGRRVEIVNDVQLLASHGRMIVAHVDTSFNGFLRRWGVDWLSRRKNRLISWRYVQPLSIEDAASSKAVSLSVTRKQISELPSEDLADALEELSGEEQEAVFGALDSDKAAETLLEAEPRAQRQLVEDLAPDRARDILSKMSAAQAADLMESLSLEERNALMELLPPEKARRSREIIAQHEATAGTLCTTDFVALEPGVTVREALARLRETRSAARTLCYLYVVQQPGRVLQGVVDLRDLVTAAENATLGDLMTAPPVSAEDSLVEDDLRQLFEKYMFRMLPVVDKDDHVLGVVRYDDVIK